MEEKIGIRLPTELKTLIECVADARGESVSTFVRRSCLKELARLSFLSLSVKKALGIDYTEEAGE